MQVDSLLVPIDFSQCSKVALGVADRWAQSVGASLWLLHVHPVVDVAVMDYAYVQPAERLAVVCEALEGQLASWSQSLRTPAERVKREVVLGAPVEEIIKRSHDVDVAVLGTHGRAGVSRFLLGSVAERVVQGAACSVFIAKNKRA